MHRFVYSCKITYLIKMLILDLHVSKFASPDHGVLLQSVGFSKLTFRGVVLHFLSH